MQEINIKVSDKVNELFELNIDKLFKGLNYNIDSLLEVTDLVKNTSHFMLGIENINLRFQDRPGLLEVLGKFVDRQISNIPYELEALENEKSTSRYWDSTQHFYETEALSEKEGKLDKIKTKLLRELNKKSKSRKQ